MINKQLINPRSIVVVGGSEDLSKPGGKVLRNIISGNYKGELFVVNPRADKVQGIKSFRDSKDLPQVDLAILAVAARFCKDSVAELAHNKSAKAFIILSAGFGEESTEGAELEKEIVDIIEGAGACLIGPNCIGVLTQTYNGVFTEPLPALNPKGIDFISGSGATAVFIMESAIPNGVSFSSVFSVGNSAHTGVEDVLKYLDETYDNKTSSNVKVLYIESVSKPEMLLKHASSLISKGCHLAAIKAGTSDAGSRAASSHTGAMANPDIAVDALFRKAGIIRCYSRLELASVASVLLNPLPKGRNMAIVTHAGGPAVMMTDELARGGIDVPAIKGARADSLLEKLFPGSSVSNPIDLLATCTAELLGYALDACENDFDTIDAVAVIFGSPGLFPLDDIYNVLDEKMKTMKKPVYPVLPSMITAGREVRDFIAKGRINFPDEVVFAGALCRVINSPRFKNDNIKPDNDKEKIRDLIDRSDNGYLSPGQVSELLDAAGIDRVQEAVFSSVEKAVEWYRLFGPNVAMKVVGPVHKSDVGGVVLGVDSIEKVRSEFGRLMSIRDTEAVLMQQMAVGTELFIGAKREEGFGHLVMAGLGGIFIEVMKDVSSGLVPLSEGEADNMICSLRGYKLLEGVRGRPGIDIGKYRSAILKISALLEAAPEIFEMDLNPLLGSPDGIVAVDARIRIEKENVK